PDRYRVEEVQLLATRPTREDEIGLFEHLEVLHDAEARHRQLGLQFGQRAAVTREEQIEQEPSAGIGERFEHPVVVRHDSKLCDQKVTCQPGPRRGHPSWTYHAGMARKL